MKIIIKLFTKLIMLLITFSGFVALHEYDLMAVYVVYAALIQELMVDVKKTTCLRFGGMTIWRCDGSYIHRFNEETDLF